MAHVLQRLVLRRQSVALHSLRMRTLKKDYKTHYLRRMLTHAGTYRTRHYFEKWAQKAKCEALADLVNVSYQSCNWFRPREMLC